MPTREEIAQKVAEELGFRLSEGTYISGFLAVPHKVWDALIDAKVDAQTAERFLETERNNHEVSILEWKRCEQELKEWSFELSKVTALGCECCPSETADFIAELTNVATERLEYGRQQKVRAETAESQLADAKVELAEREPMKELEAGLASVGIKCIPPTDLRNKAGMLMFNRGVKMGVKVDPADVQEMLVEFAESQLADSELRVKELESELAISQVKVNVAHRNIGPLLERAEAAESRVKELSEALRDMVGAQTCVWAGRETVKLASDALKRARAVLSEG